MKHSVTHQHKEHTNHQQAETDTAGHMSHDIHSGHSNHDIHEGHSPDIFKKKFWLSLLLTIPVVVYSHTIMDLLGYSPPVFPGNSWMPAILGSLVFFYGGLVFLKGARHELTARAPGMMTLIAMAITVAFLYSMSVSLNFLDGMDFWWEVSTLIVIMLLGHWLEMASVMNARGALQELANLLPDEAELVTKDGTRTVPISELRIGNLVLVRPGSSIPTDGIVVKGMSEVNESMLTGESKLIKKSKGTAVIGGTINGSGALTIKVSKIGGDTALAGIMKLVEEAQTSKSKTQILADRAAFYLTFIAIGAALLTLLGWTLFSDRSAAFIIERVVTVLVIACPHALGLAIPLVTAISTTLAAKNGLLVRDRLSLESARNIDTVLFDKTGTLTQGKQGIVDIFPAYGTKSDVLAWAASIENESEHPIARAIVASAKLQKIGLLHATEFKSLAGRGAQSKIKGKLSYVGGPNLLRELGITVTDELKRHTAAAGSEGKTVVYVTQGKKLYGVIVLADVIRTESKEAVMALQKNSIRVAILTGDSKSVAAWVAAELGVDEYYAEVLPEHKVATVKKLQADGSKVAMVGDGVNDAPALAQADIGIAIGAGTDTAIESAGIILAGSDPRGVAKIITLSNATYRKMQQNLLWATGYNALAIPLATGVTAGMGFVLSPALGAVLMSLSTIVVAINAQFLRNTKL